MKVKKFHLYFWLLIGSYYKNLVILFNDLKIWQMWVIVFIKILSVATLTLGSRPRQGVARLRAKRKPKNEGKCEGMNPNTPKGASHLGSLES
jgi:hypothetical protein